MQQNVNGQTRVTVGVVCLNEIDNIRSCLDSLLAQTYPPELLEILVVDNDSTDGTKEVVASYCERDSRVRLVVNEVRGIAVSRKAVMREAKYPFVAFTSADCVAPPDWLETLVLGLERHRARGESVAAVGGANIPDSREGKFLESLAIVVDTFWGNHGSAQGKRFNIDTEVPHIPTSNILYDKEMVAAIGGFDTGFWNVCEDTELNQRLTSAGYRIVFISGSFVWHKIERTPGKWFRTMITYGKGRMWVIRKHSSHFRVMYILPPLLVVSLCCVVLTPWSWLFALPFLYVPAVLAVSGFECAKRGRLGLLHRVAAIYVITHIGFGIGELYALVVNRKQTVAPETLS